MRIVSLLPSATEILFAIGAGEHVVGVTFECDEPVHARSTRSVVSNTTLPPGLSPGEIDKVVRAKVEAGEDLYTLDEGVLAGLAPEVVVTQDLCAVCAIDVDDVDDALAHLGCKAQVVTLDPMTLEGVLESVITLGAVTGRVEGAEALVGDLRSRLAQCRAAVAGRPTRRVTVLEWTDPAFSAGHWIPDMVVAAGGIPGLAAPGQRSGPVTWDAVRASDPEVIVVAPCGFRTDGAAGLARGLLSDGLLPESAEVWAVDADAAFVRPGPRLVDGVEALAGVLHPGAGPARPELVARVA